MAMRLVLELELELVLLLLKPQALASWRHHG